MKKLTVALAGVPVEFLAEYEENTAFFAGYETEQPGAFSVVPGPEILKKAEDEIRKEYSIPETAEIPAWYIENNALHRLIAEELIHFDVLLVHASAVVVDDEAYLFMAKSGTGKSTHTRLWREYLGDRAWMLNDDKPLLRVVEDGVWAYGTPWNGKHHLSRNAKAKVKGIARIVRSEENSIERVAAGQAFPLLYQHAYRPEEKEAMKKILSLEQRILRQVPFYTLRCNMEQEAAAIAYRTMKDGGIR